MVFKNNVTALKMCNLPKKRIFAKNSCDPLAKIELGGGILGKYNNYP